MSISEIPAVLARHKLLFALTFGLCLAAVVGVTAVLPKTYEATATMYVGTEDSSASADELVRTYAALAGNPNIADSVRRELPFRLTRHGLLDRMSFKPVARTQLLELTAAASTAARARLIANTYASVYGARMADRFAANRIQERVSVSEPAALPTSPAKPNPPLYIGLGAILSLLLAAGAVLLRETWRPRPRIRPDAPEAFDLPVLGRIPKLGRGHREGADEAEDAFAWLRTGLDGAVGAEGHQVLAVASPSPGDGKSTIAANLAVTLTAEGERVVVVEADLRRPSLHETIVGEGLERTQLGLADHLQEFMSTGELIAASPKFPGLHVIWAGTLPQHPTRTLRAGGLEVLLTLLRSQFDRVIVDTPPVAAGPDAALVAGSCEGTLFVVDLQRTTLPAVRVGLDRLRVTGANVLGIVLNRVAAARSDGYYAVAPPVTATASRTVRRV